jgi:uncharacterized protein YjaG (DUF416 family)
MATIKAYTDIHQSKKLAEFLPLESADMHYHYDNDFGELESIPTITEEDDHFALFPKDFSCWSLAKLLDILPKIHGAKPILDLEENSIQYTGIDLYVVADNPVDACVAMIELLHELKML